jgi:hypothetical protein
MLHGARYLGAAGPGAAQCRQMVIMRPMPAGRPGAFARAIEAAFYKQGRRLVPRRARRGGGRGRRRARPRHRDRRPDLLARLAELGIRAETLAALTLIPLIETAWADGVMDAKERAAVLHGAATSGIAPDSASYRLLEIWTMERPAPEISAIWREFIAAIAESLDERERAALRAKIIGRAWAVANAAGSFLDAAPSVSARSPPRSPCSIRRSAPTV